jgi:hypothetical protein
MSVRSATTRHILFLVLGILGIACAIGLYRGPRSRLNPIHYYYKFVLNRPRTVATEAGALIVKPYGATELRVSRENAAFDVAVNPDSEASGGVFLEPEIAQAPNARVHVSFDVSGHDEVVVRTGVEGAFNYRAARGRNGVLFDGRRIAETYVYLPKPGTFSLRNIKLAKCQAPFSPECKNDEDLVDQIKKSPGFPGLDDRLKLAMFLLDWGANEADYDMGKSLQTVANEEFAGATAAEIYYQYYVPSLAGGYCGSLAIFQSKLFRAFGLDAFTINFGILKPNLTHVSVVVRDEASGRYFLLDPTFNGYFTSAGAGAPLDIDELLGAAPESITFKDQPLNRRDYLALKSELPDFAQWSTLHDCKDITVDNKSAIRCRRDDTRLENFWDGGILEAAKSAGISPNAYGFVELMKRGFFNVGDALNPNTRADFTALLQKHRIAVGTPSG